MRTVSTLRRRAHWTSVVCVLAWVAPVSADVPDFAAVRNSWFDTTSAAPSLVSLRDTDSSPDASLLHGAELVDACNNCCDARLFGLFAPSDCAFYNFVSPQSNPLLFEDPRTLTEVRFHFVNQWIPNTNPVFQGGTAQFLAAQVRVALTQRLSVIATKDGYLWLNPAGAAVPNTEGFANVAGGLKYNLIRNPETQTIVSAGFTHEFASGAQRVFQGNGNGEWNLFLTGGREFFGCAHWVSGAGLRLPNDDVQSSSMYWSNAFDVQLTQRLYAMLQFNWFHWYESGTALPVNFEGNDLFNLGSTNVAGNDIVTMSFGPRYKFGRYHEAGVAYELPLTQRDDLLESRLYVDLILRY